MHLLLDRRLDQRRGAVLRLRHRVEHLGDELPDLAELGDAETARRAGRRAEPDAGGHERLFRIERNAVLVAGEPGADQRLLRDVALHALRPEIDQHQMVVGAAGDDVEAAALQRRRKRPRILDDALRIDLEVGPQRLAERDRLRGDDMHQRPALQAGEDRRVDLLRDLLVVGEDQAAARTAQRLVRGRRDDMRMRDRRRMHAAGDEPGEMRHVDHQIGADRIGDLAEALEIPDARIGRAAGDDELRLVGVRDPLDLVVVEQLVLAPHAVGHDLEPFARTC